MGSGFDIRRWRADDTADAGSSPRSDRSPPGRCSQRSLREDDPRRPWPVRRGPKPRSLGDFCFQSSGLTELASLAPVAAEQFLRAWRTFAAGLINLQSLGARLLPGVEERLHRPPAGLDAVGALKQDIVADHAVVDQGLIAGARLGLEVVLVAEFHFDAAGRDRGTRNLGIELQRDAFVRLDADHQMIFGERLDGCASEHPERRFLELDRDFGALDAERLAGAQVEGNAGPTPVVDLQLEGDVGLG